VSILYRLLLVLMTVRLLLPPGVCICKMQAPAARFLILLFHSNRPIPVDEHDDDHHADGCPASKNSVGLGLRPVHVPAPVLLAAMVDFSDRETPYLSIYHSETEETGLPPPDLLLTCCTLRI